MRKRNPHVPPRLRFHLDRLEFRLRLTHSLIMGMRGQSRYCEIRLPPPRGRMLKGRNFDPESAAILVKAFRGVVAMSPAAVSLADGPGLDRATGPASDKV